MSSDTNTPPMPSTVKIICTDCSSELAILTQKCQSCDRPLCGTCYHRAIKIAKDVSSPHHHICDMCGWMEIG